jgi:hypothetical protein
MKVKAEWTVSTVQVPAVRFVGSAVMVSPTVCAVVTTHIMLVKVSTRCNSRFL